MIYDTDSALLGMIGEGTIGGEEAGNGNTCTRYLIAGDFSGKVSVNSNRIRRFRISFGD